MTRGNCDHCNGWFRLNNMCLLPKHNDTTQARKLVPNTLAGKVISYQSSYTTCRGSHTKPREQE